MVISGCSSDIDMWDLEWPSTIIGNTATYPCYMSNGMLVLQCCASPLVELRYDIVIVFCVDGSKGLTVL